MYSFSGIIIKLCKSPIYSRTAYFFIRLLNGNIGGMAGYEKTVKKHLFPKIAPNNSIVLNLKGLFLLHTYGGGVITVNKEWIMMGIGKADFSKNYTFP